MSMVWLYCGSIFIILFLPDVVLQNLFSLAKQKIRKHYNHSGKTKMFCKS